MSNWHELQADFSGGEISQRMFMREDLEVHGKSTLIMENFMPTLQGTAVRSPGTRFLWEMVDALDVGVLDARIVPYLTPNNQRALVEIIPSDGVTDGDIRIRQDIGQYIGDIPDQGGFDPDGTQKVFRRIVWNDSFSRGEENWTLIDPEYTGGGGDRLGWWVTPGNNMSGVARNTKYPNQDNPTIELRTTATVPETTSKLEIEPWFWYVQNFSGPDAKIEGTISVGTTVGGTEIWTHDFSDQEIGTEYRQVASLRTVDFPGGVDLVAGTVLHLTFKVTALKDSDTPEGSTPNFLVRQFRLKTLVDADVGSVILNASVPYREWQLDEIQFVQSPYNNSANINTSVGNELVLVHPSFAPRRLYYNGASYVFEVIPFTYSDGSGQAQDVVDSWIANGYPATCTSYLGRLVLAGANRDPTLGSQTGSNTEKIWMTEVGSWYQFTNPTQTPVTAADSIQFSSTYRSPIQWVHGQQNLLVGAESYEYVSQADGIFSPGDIGVFLQSTHGSSRIQPVPMGQYALFAAEQGSRVRAMQYVAESEYWIAPDMTLFHPELFAKGAGIRRMVRMRNPHQMCVCVMGNGQLAILHQDSYANITGWSRINLGNQVTDACVQTKEDGTDVLYLLVKRKIEGVDKLYLEAIVDWTYEEEFNWNYMRSAVTISLDTPSNVFTGLDYLNNRVVQVTSGGDYLGSWRVTGGTVTLLTDNDLPIVLSEATFGLAAGARVRTMPLISEDPGSRKRYAHLYVRCLNSARPMINGKRPPDRDPDQVLATAQDLDIIRDYEDVTMTWNRTQVVDVFENLPVRTEIVGIYGKVAGNTL